MRFIPLLILLISLARAELDTAPLAAWLDRQGEVRSLQAEFVQERRLPALKNPVSTPGTLAMLRPGKLRWELGDPVKTLAVSDGATMTLADVAKKQARRIPADSARARQFTLLSDGAFRDLASFRDAFELVESRVTRGIYQITVRPLDRTMRDKVPWLFLDIDPAKNELRALELELSDKSRIRTVFSKTQLNPSLDPAIFTPDFSDYKVR